MHVSTETEIHHTESLIGTTSSLGVLGDKAKGFISGLTPPLIPIFTEYGKAPPEIIFCSWSSLMWRYRYALAACAVIIVFIICYYIVMCSSCCSHIIIIIYNERRITKIAFALRHTRARLFGALDWRCCVFRKSKTRCAEPAPLKHWRWSLVLFLCNTQMRCALQNVKWLWSCALGVCIFLYSYIGD